MSGVRLGAFGSMGHASGVVSVGIAHPWVFKVASIGHITQPRISQHIQLPDPSKTMQANPTLIGRS